jgi:choice-of-anchor C domain-containing protein
MRTRTLTFLAALALVVMAFWATPSMANLIQNGSFEYGIPNDVSGFTTVYATPALQRINNWTVTANSVDWIGAYWDASDGSRSIDMTGTPGNGTIASTSFATTAGATYKVTFDMSGNFDGNIGTNRSLEVSAANDSATYTYTKAYPWDPSNMHWLSKEFIFTAGAGSSSVLQFKAVDNGTETVRGPVIDNVQASMIPIPGAMILLGAGLLRLVTYSRRKRTLA